MQHDARRTVRLPLRAPAVLVFGAGRFEVIAEDLTAGGCGFVSPLPLRRGEAVHLTIRLPGAPLSAPATVAWARSGLPHRVGVAFSRAGARERGRRVKRLLDAYPALARHLPPLPPRARLRAVKGPGPQELLTREERAVMQAAATGATALALLRTATGDGIRRALFHLRARGLVAEGPARGEPAPRTGPDETAAPPHGAEELARTRPPRATAYLEMSRAEQAAGHLASGVAWLQAAASAAPDDAEIQGALDALTLPGEP
jgi:hypothetical protein